LAQKRNHSFIFAKAAQNESFVLARTWRDVAENDPAGREMSPERSIIAGEFSVPSLGAEQSFRDNFQRVSGGEQNVRGHFCRVLGADRKYPRTFRWRPAQLPSDPGLFPKYPRIFLKKTRKRGTFPPHLPPRPEMLLANYQHIAN
jgi:hypothetical protein